jgi:hypothetical protein
MLESRDVLLNIDVDFMIDAIFWSVEEIAAKATNMYADGIQQQVETHENIGQILTIDVELICCRYWIQWLLDITSECSGSNEFTTIFHNHNYFS